MAGKVALVVAISLVSFGIGIGAGMFCGKQKECNVQQSIIPQKPKVVKKKTTTKKTNA